MRIVVQIPCYNEEQTLASVVADVKAAMQGYDDVKLLVIDDGSVDKTIEIAKAAGVDYIARHFYNEGLAKAYMTGLAASLNIGADVIVNTDADNQYKASDIPALMQPVFNHNADLVVGVRPIVNIEHFSPIKKALQKLGSFVARLMSGTSVEDATSGFRAINREAAIRLNTFSTFSYTLETLIQAGRSGLRVRSIPISINPPTRPSRLFRSMSGYVLRTSLDMLRVFTVYAPFRSFGLAGLLPFAFALIIGLRYLILITLFDPTRSHAPSLILAAIAAMLGFILWAIGIIGELLNINRRLLEEIRLTQRREMAEHHKVQSRCDFELIDLKKIGTMV